MSEPVEYRTYWEAQSRARHPKIWHLRECLAASKKRIAELESLIREQQMASAKHLAAELEARLMQLRADWLAANDPKDGTDCVTPFDVYLYGKRD